MILFNGEHAVRNYSICSNPSRTDVYEVAVLREDDGTGGSIALHQQYELGQTFHCEAPKNHFECHSDERPAVLIAGGIGITPIKAMAQAFKTRNVDITLHYAGRSHKEMAFRDRLQREFGENIFIYGAAENQRMDIEHIIASAPNKAVFYLCGPNRLSLFSQTGRYRVPVGLLRIFRHQYFRLL
jgi:ferredoxin-NADP reductase